MEYAILYIIVFLPYCLCEYHKNAFNRNLLVLSKEIIIVKVIFVIYN